MKTKVVGLGDVVQVFEGAFGTGAVTVLHDDGTVDVVRPYIHTADFSCSGPTPKSLSVIAYTGLETVRNMNPERLKVLVKGGEVR